MREITAGISTGLTEVQSRVCPVVGCVAKLDVLITTHINFNWTDGNAV